MPKNITILSPKALVKELQRVLKPGGNLLVTVPFVFETHESPNYYRYTRHGLEWLLTGFSQVHIQANRGTFCVMFHFLRLNVLGHVFFPLLNNIGYLLDKMVFSRTPRITLGYTVMAIK